MTACGPPQMIYLASELQGWPWPSKIDEYMLCVTRPLMEGANYGLCCYNWCPALPLTSPSFFLFRLLSGSRASPTTRLRDRRLLRWRRGLIPIQRVRPEEGTEEDRSARTQFKQDKAGAAGLESSWAAGGARLFCGSQNARCCRALWTLFFFVSLLMFLFS